MEPCGGGWEIEDPDMWRWSCDDENRDYEIEHDCDPDGSGERIDRAYR